LLLKEYAALGDHHRALHRQASLPQAVVTDHQNGNGGFSFPSSPMTDAPYHPPENRPLPPSLHSAQSCSAQQNDTQALHSLLGALSISPADPSLVRHESSVTNIERNIGPGWTVLKDDELPNDIGHMVKSLPARPARGQGPTAVLRLRNSSSLSRRPVLIRPPTIRDDSGQSYSTVILHSQSFSATAGKRTE
jgi:hypothetical protein